MAEETTKSSFCLSFSPIPIRLTVQASPPNECGY